MTTGAPYSRASNGRWSANAGEIHSSTAATSLPISMLWLRASKPSWSHFRAVPVNIASVARPNIATPMR